MQFLSRQYLGMKLALVVITFVMFVAAGCSAKWGDPDGDQQPEVTEVEMGNPDPIECTLEDKQRGVC